MARKSRLLAALDVHRGRVYELEKQKQLQKQAKKRKRSQEPADSDRPHPMVGSSDGHESLGVAPSNVILSRQTSGVSHGDQAEESVDGEQDQEREDEGIPFSDIESLASSERADILPHQHLTIYNVNALLNVHKLITLPYVSLPFSAHQTLTTSIPVSIPDVNDDLNRELAFYKQCLDTARDGRALLKQEGILFSRPNDYFAEMVKSDEHMGKVKQKMVDEAANKKAASEARRQRDLKKFGKQVQVAKEQERAKSRRETMDKISSLKRTGAERTTTDTATTKEDDPFDVALEDAARNERQTRRATDAEAPTKRRKKDDRFGFGGKKRFSKSGDALSTGDMRGFSEKGMKGRQRGTKRLGKGRRDNRAKTA